ncbi:hypothetical protein ACLOJK_032876 [Asimina triloba]
MVLRCKHVYGEIHMQERDIAIPLQQPKNITVNLHCPPLSALPNRRILAHVAREDSYAAPKPARRNHPCDMAVTREEELPLQAIEKKKGEAGNEMGLSFKLSKVGTRYRPKLSSPSDILGDSRDDTLNAKSPISHPVASNQTQVNLPLCSPCSFDCLAFPFLVNMRIGKNIAVML